MARRLLSRFDVSRTPVREALRRLSALGLVSFEPNRGVRVPSISPGELREAFLVRAELEFTDYGTVDAHCRLGQGQTTIVPLTLLPPA
jgi:DNA-binding FadR family transcriptional regulator